MPSIIELLDEASAILASTDARMESMQLLEGVCAVSLSHQYSHPDDELSVAQAERYRSALKRRLSGEPLAYITGMRGFWDMDLQVTPDVLIPRPDTECLVEEALERIPHDACWRIADLGTGSGAVAIAIARERPQSQVTATDISHPALAVAEQNAMALSVSNINFRAGSWYQPLQQEKFDLIASNPPYIRADDPHLQAGDLPAEPSLAQVSGHDGLEAIRQIISESITYLKPAGWLLLEHGYEQAKEVTVMLADAGLEAVFTRRDYGGNDRVSGAMKK